MKRISLWIVIAALAPVVSRADFISSQDYRLRYSPYAFNYHNSGLIPGGIKYSPYAFNPNDAGLVYEGARYTPYAFNYHSTGLVVDYYWWQIPRAPTVIVECGPAPGRVTAATPARRRAYAARRRSLAMQRTRQIAKTDGEQIVRQYLEAQDLDRVHIDRRLTIGNQTAGAAFILRDKNLVVRYTNPEIMEALQADGGTSVKLAQRYKENWDDFARQFETRGGTVYRVDASEPDQIVAALAACDLLRPEGAAEQITMVAKE